MTFVVPLLALTVAAPPAPPDAKSVEFFEQHIRPILVEHCYQCHAADAKKVRGGLLLDARAGWQKGGDTGPAIIPGDIDKSLLIKAVRYDDEALKMPPKGKLTDKQIAALTEWVKMGAPDPRDGTAAAAVKTIDVDKAKDYWA